MSESDFEDFESADEGETIQMEDGNNELQDKVEIKNNAHSQSLPVVEQDVSDSKVSDSENTWSSWGRSWGASFLTSTKTGVTCLAKELGDGITTVSKTVESVLDVPSPETLIEMETKKCNIPNEDDLDSVDKVENEEPDNSCSITPLPDEVSVEAESSWYGGWGVSSFTSTVSKTGSMLFTGSIDLLENIGKKTMHVLEENDPGLERTKALLRRGERPNLTALLKEAQSKSGDSSAYEDSVGESFPSQFEAMNGSAYLEGLGNLSKRCGLKLHAELAQLDPEKSRKTRKHIMKVQITLKEISSEDFVSECDSDDGSASQISEDLQTALSTFPEIFAKPNQKFTERLSSIFILYEDRESWFEEGVVVLQQRCVRDLAQLTAFTVDHLLRLGNHIATHSSECSSLGLLVLSELLVSLCLAMLTAVDFVRRIYCSALLKVGGEQVNQAVTAVILEAENAKAYIQDGFLLLVPVLQLAVVCETKPPIS